MNRREFLGSAAAMVAVSVCPGRGQSTKQEHGFPESVLKGDPYIEKAPIAGYQSAPLAS